MGAIEELLSVNAHFQATMDVILNELLTSQENEVISSTDKEKYLEILEASLQSETKNYDDYFSSRPNPGSIVEEIAELDAHISTLERKLRKLLVDNKDLVLTDIFSSDGNEKLSEIHKELEQLWEIDNDRVDTEQNGDPELSVEEFLEQNTDVKKQDDQFHIALKKLKERSTKEKDDHDFSGNLTLVLENLNNVTDLMELPFLARTCIRTGHYQEAVMVYTYSKSLLSNFPNSSIVRGICANVSKETTTTMLTGLVRLLSTNVTVISLKKILNYLVSIPPFDNKNKDALLKIYLHMRFNFINGEQGSFSLSEHGGNDSLIEMMVKRKIEVLREHIHVSLSVFVDTFQIETQPLYIPLGGDLSQESQEKQTDTNLFMLEFISNCVNSLLNDLREAQLQEKLGESVCLQLVYCSFRLQDLNFNYHSLFLNKIYESGLFTVEALRNAIEKRRELQSKYS